MNNIYKKLCENPSDILDVCWTERKYKNFFCWCIKNNPSILIYLMRLSPLGVKYLTKKVNLLCEEGCKDAVIECEKNGVILKEYLFQNVINGCNMDLVKYFVGKFGANIVKMDIFSIINVGKYYSLEDFCYFVELGMNIPINLNFLNITFLEAIVYAKDKRIHTYLLERGHQLTERFLINIVKYNENFEEIIDGYGVEYNIQWMEQWGIINFGDRRTKEFLEVLVKKGYNILCENQKYYTIVKCNNYSESVKYFKKLL